MSVFDLKGGASNAWNYSDKTKPGYATSITGTVVEISNPQALDYQTKQPKVWPDGNPVRNLRVVIKGQSGREASWTFAPKSKAADACLIALDPQGDRPAVSIEELIGKLVTISTAEGVYNAQNPRPWNVAIQGLGDQASVRGLKDLSGATLQAQPAPQPQPQAQPQMTPQQFVQGFNTELYAEDIPF